MNPVTYENDWVILKLSSPLELNVDVFPACLPSSKNYMNNLLNSMSNSEDGKCFTSGWGTLLPGMNSGHYKLAYTYTRNLVYKKKFRALTGIKPLIICV